MNQQDLRTILGPLLFRELPDPLFVVSPEGVLLDVNRAAAAYFRRQPDEIVGRSLTELFPPDQAERQLCALRSVLQNGVPFVEERVTELGNERYLLRYQVELLRSPDGALLGVLGMVRDVTAFAALERKYAALYEGATDALFAIDSEGGIRAPNRQTEVLSGYSREELEKLKIWDVIDPAEVSRLQGYLRARAAGEDAPTAYENRWIHASGESRWAEVRISREPFEAGVFQASVRDITERRRLEELRRDFVHMITHDVKAPLSVIQGYAQGLAAGRFGETSPQQADCLSQIHNASRRLGRMMDQFLTAERLDSSESWEPDPGPAEVLADGVVRSFLPDAEARGIELTLHCQGAEQLKVVDREALHRILDNLVSNALKFTPPGGRVAVRLAAGEGGVTAAVEDSGAGIPPEEGGRVFERFYRAPTARGHGGSGLGLYIARRLAERCGGRVTVSSEPGKGSRFEVWLPAGS